MAMPKTAVDKYYLFMFRQDNIGIAWKIFTMKAKTVAHLVQERADDFFGLCIFALDVGHDLAAFFFCKDVH